MRIGNSPFSTLLLIGSLSLSGCYYPYSYQTVEGGFQQSPYRNAQAFVNGQTLEIDVSDPSLGRTRFENEKVRNATFVRGVVIADSRRYPLKLQAAGNSGDGVNYLFNLKDSGFDGDEFSLEITLNLSGKPFMLTGKFSVHGHFKIVSLDDIAG